MANAKILVVEDEGIVAMDIKNRLERLGYSVPTTASTGTEAVKIVTETYPDLVLMDIMLKGDMDGIETAEQIQRHFDIPVVYLTAYADNNTLSRAKITEPFAYILKPFEERELYSAIEIALYKHQAEKKLKENKVKLSLFRNLINQSNEAIFVIDPETSCFLDINDKTCSNLGYKREELLNLGVIHIECAFPDHISWEKYVNEIKRKGYDIRESIYKRKDGTKFPVEVNVTYITLMDKEYLVAVARDITERKQAEEELQKAKNRYQRIVEDLPDLICRFKPDTTITFVNEAYAKYFDTTADELIGNSFLDIIPPENHEYVQKKIATLDENSPVATMEYEVVTPKGERKWQLWRNRALFDSSGNITEIQSIGQDITERKNIEALILENERLISANKARSEFLTIMSHELRAPLTSAIGYSILLKEKTPGKLNEKQELYVDNILTSSRHLLDLINGILDLAKIEAGKLEIVIEDVPVHETIRETLDLMKEKAARDNVVIKTEFDPALDVIQADRHKFKQILFNLLSNAVKFRKPEGGTVTVTTEKEGDMVKISVSDTGIGIKEEDMPRLFQKFGQLDSGLSRKYQGTGLGLAITKQLVELHEGKIMVESKYGEGSTFTLLLPIARKKQGIFDQIN